MTESGSGQRDDQGREQNSTGGTGSGDDYTPSASWDTSRDSSWQNSDPYESPYANPGSAASGGTGPSAASAGSAAERPADGGAWPGYPTPTYDAPTYGAPTYGAPPQGTNPYQQPVYPPVPQQAYAQPYGALPEHPQGTTILVLGIVGLFFTICAPIAWYMGSKAQKEIAASGIRYANEQNINIGKVLGMVLTILAIVGLAIAVVFIVIAIIAAVASSAG